MQLTMWIGLFPVTVCQALFIAPCSHSFHYKCIRGTLYEHHPGFSCPLCRSFHDLEADVELDMPEEEEEWEEAPEPEGTPAAAGVEPAEVDGGADGDGEHEGLAPIHGDATGMDLSDGNGNSNPHRRSMDDEDDIPHGFRTAAEDNDRRTLLPQSITAHQAHHPAMPPTPVMMGSAARRPPRRGTTLVTPINHQGPFSEEIDRGFDTDAGVVGGYGAETDMDIDEPSRGGHYRQHSNSNGNSRNASANARGRSTIYNLVHGATTNSTAHGTVNEHGSLNGHNGGHNLHHTYAGSAGMSSAPNLLRPGSSLGHAHGSGTGNTTPPIPASSSGPGAFMSPISSGRAINASAQNYQQQPPPPHHPLAHSSSNPGAPRGVMSSPQPSGSAVSHLFGDAGASSSDRERDELIGGDDPSIEAGNPNGGFSSAGKRKR